jgi:hypothetical protein
MWVGTARPIFLKAHNLVSDVISHFEPPMLSGSRDVDTDRHFWSQRGLGEARIARHGGHLADLEDSGVFYATSQTLEMVNFSAVTS